MDGDGATDSTAHMYSNMADFLANDVKATPTAMGLYPTDNQPAAMAMGWLLVGIVTMYA